VGEDMGNGRETVVEWLNLWIRTVRGGLP